MQETPDNLTLRFHPRGGEGGRFWGFRGRSIPYQHRTLVLRAASVASMTFWSEFTDSRPLVLGRGRPCSHLGILPKDILSFSLLVTRNSILIKKKRKGNKFVFFMIAAFVSFDKVKGLERKKKERSIAWKCYI